MINHVPKRKCFLALFDILGFKNMVGTDKLANIYATYDGMKSVVDNTRNMQKSVDALLKREVVTINNYSDSFLVYTEDMTGKEQAAIDHDFIALMATCDALFYAANENKLPIRGAITSGELIVDQNIHIGSPIVEAYELEQKQDWIGCWVTKKALSLISKEEFDKQISTMSIVEYEIPCKQGKIESGFAYNWIDGPTVRDFDAGFLAKTEYHDWAIERKHRNTRDFIKFIRK